MAGETVVDESKMQQMAECSTARQGLMLSRIDANKIRKMALKTIFRMP